MDSDEEYEQERGRSTSPASRGYLSSAFGYAKNAAKSAAKSAVLTPLSSASSLVMSVSSQATQTVRFFNSYSNVVKSWEQPWD
jgi:hypothetical protein